MASTLTSLQESGLLCWDLDMVVFSCCALAVLRRPYSCWYRSRALVQEPSAGTGAERWYRSRALVQEPSAGTGAGHYPAGTGAGRWYRTRAFSCVQAYSCLYRSRAYFCWYRSQALSCWWPLVQEPGILRLIQEPGILLLVQEPGILLLPGILTNDPL